MTLLLYQPKIYYLKGVRRERKLKPLLIYVCQIHIKIFVKVIYIPFQVVPVYAAVLKHIFSGWPGRSADGSVLKHSPLSQTLPQLIDNNSEYLRDIYHIVGDKAFTLNTRYFKTLQKEQTMISYKCTKDLSQTFHVNFPSNEHKEVSKDSVDELMRTFHYIQFESKRKRLFFI